MRQRILSVMKLVKLKERPQLNEGRVEIDMKSFRSQVKKCGGKLKVKASKKVDHQTAFLSRNKNKTCEVENIVQIVRPRKGCPRKSSFFATDESQSKDDITPLVHTLEKKNEQAIVSHKTRSRHDIDAIPTIMSTSRKR